AERHPSPDAVPPPRRGALRPGGGRRVRRGPDDLRRRVRTRRDGRLVPRGAGAAARARLPSPASGPGQDRRRYRGEALQVRLKPAPWTSARPSLKIGRAQGGPVMKRALLISLLIAPALGAQDKDEATRLR